MEGGVPLLDGNKSNDDDVETVIGRITRKIDHAG